MTYAYKYEHMQIYLIAFIAILHLSITNDDFCVERATTVELTSQEYHSKTALIVKCALKMTSETLSNVRKSYVNESERW